MAKYLIVNPGSASKKYALFDRQGNCLASFHFEKEKNNFLVNGKKISSKDYFSAPVYLFGVLLEKKIIKNKEEILAAGIRLVAPGEYFAAHRKIDAQFLKKLAAQKSSAPLHIGPALEEIKFLRKFLPKTKFFAISDSAFYKDLPERAKFYGLPITDAKKFDLRRFGYHGLSMGSILRQLKKFGRLPPKIIICHLGGGVTISAIKNGKVIDTSMGFTPLEGLLMATRSGDIDPGAILYLAKKKNFNFSQLEEYLNKKSGLLGLSGFSSDVRELLEKEKKDKLAKLALEVFAYRIQKYISAYFGILGGLDLLVFSATIGERSAIMRSRICQNLSHLGIWLDEKKNKKTINKSTLICHKKSAVKISVTPTQEALEMFKLLKFTTVTL